jgi:anti-sigma factor RsiW
MNCEEIRDLLAVYVGGETHENERIAIEAHLPSCEACKGVFHEYRELRSQMAELKEGTAPAGAIEAIWPGVREQISPRTNKSGRVLAFEWLIRAAAVVVIGVAFGYSTMQVARPAQASSATPTVANPDLMPGSGAREAGGNGGRAWGPSVMPQIPLNGNTPRTGPKAPGNPYLPRVEKILDGDETEF